ncbi:MAG TPA: FxDxF family PEP-CTERM protein [Methylibium sp.]|nr:FxDxF family PEP-CTERM protein [Methylibium sp.]
MQSRLKALAAASLIATGGAANALIVDFYDGTDLIATMETSLGTVFELDFVAAPSSGAFIDYINLAGPGGLFLNLGSQAASASYSAGGFTDAGETYNWRVDFPNSNGPGSDRFAVGDTATWTIAVTDPDAWDFNMLHVNAFLNGESIKLESCVRGADCVPTTPIPEPSTYALMLAGLGIVGWMARRRRPV